MLLAMNLIKQLKQYLNIRTLFLITIRGKIIIEIDKTYAEQ